MPNVLIISPSFPPKNTADSHRVRLSLAYYKNSGWTPTVLCVAPEYGEGLDDPLLAEALPADISVVRIKVWDEKVCRRFGFGLLAYRSLLPLYRAGSRLLRQRDFEVVFFSTTVFLTFVLGRVWKRLFGCAVVYDFQDPWYRETPRLARAAGSRGSWKQRVDRFLARYLERIALKAADHIVTVSEAYVHQLLARYRFLDATPFTVLPFPAPVDDYRFFRERGSGRKVFATGKGVNWVSVGRAGDAGMDPVLVALFQTLSEMRSSAAGLPEGLRLRFVGTNYAPPDRTSKLVEPLARQCGVGDLVEEASLRVPYFEALSLYAESDAALLIGSIHGDYTASRLLGCVLSKKPILALFHRQSLVTRLASRFPNVFLATFDESPAEPGFREEVARGIAWLQAPAFDPTTIDREIEPWSAEAQTRQLCAIFDSVRQRQSSPLSAAWTPGAR